MSQSKEIELKFQLSSPKEIRAILADELFAGQEKKKQLHSILRIMIQRICG